VGEERGREESPAPPAKVPTSFGFELTLAPHGSKTVAFHGDQDVLLSGMSANAAGPAVVEIKMTNAPPAGTPVLPIPGSTFTEYLERELPVHFAAAAGEELSQWVEKNRVLTDAACAGDDEAFFDLLARDPRQLASELTLGRVITWRTEVDEYNRFFRFKASRFFAPAGAAADAQHRMEEARKKLGRLGASQLELYDQRGKRPLPPAYLARGFYYGLLCLLQGLRASHSLLGDSPMNSSRTPVRGSVLTTRADLNRFDFLCVPIVGRPTRGVTDCFAIGCSPVAPRGPERT
jgi:hypothetical protein